MPTVLQGYCNAGDGSLKPAFFLISVEAAFLGHLGGVMGSEM
jgi:hypothetical protein